MTTPRIGFEYSDAGSPETEDNDCAVRALSIATRTGYRRAHKQLEEFGRKPKGRTHCFRTNNAYRNSTLGGYTIEPIYELKRKKPHTLRWFLKNYDFPNRCIVRIPGHVFAIVKGSIHDDQIPALRKHVLKVWKVSR